MIPISLQSCLSFAFIVFLLLPMGTVPLRYRGLVLLAVLLVGLIPFPSGLSLAGYLRGITDELAITSVVWMIAGVLCRLGWLRSWPVVSSWQIWSVFAVLGVVLYPASMGVGMLDTYGWGYAPRMMIAGIGLLALGLLLLGNALAVLMLTLATFAFLVEIKASDNYWDYLLDPFIVLYSIGALITNAISAAIKLRRAVFAPVPQLDESN